MGCDIHIIAQKRDANGKWVKIEGEFSEGPSPFDWRQYGMFAFLADVRNYSDIKPLSQPRGFPEDFDRGAVEEFVADGDHGDEVIYDWMGDHSYSWLSVAELSAVDYDQMIEDRRVARQVGPNSFSGAETCAAGEGEQKTLRDFLGPDFMADLAKLQEIGAERIVFGFDS
jgi:hypothetical protein